MPNQISFSQQKFLLPLYSLLACVFIAMLHFQIEQRFLIKPLPIILLAVFVAFQKSGKFDLLFVVALLFSAAGDVALELHPSKYFVVGLSLFAVTHLLYILIFVSISQLKKTRMFTSLLILPYAIGFAIWISPELGNLSLPVFFYIGIITCMVISSVTSIAPSHLILGCLLFMISDSLIAVNKFVQNFSGARYYIMITYYLGQYLIAYGWMHRTSE